MSTQAPQKETTQPPVKEAVAPKFCLSGSGQEVKGRKAHFAIGGDAKLKSKLIKEAIDGKKDPTISKEAREYAATHWERLVKELADGTHDQLQRAKRKAEALKAEPAKTEAK